MPGIKTAVSIEKSLFEKAEKLAHNMNVSRSKLFSLAINEYLKKQENYLLLAQLNSVYGEDQNQEEENLFQFHQENHKNIIEQEKW
ncbi:ribbon-helix-helix domain-containing protein [bacterium]|nr:ribbon-helix-helix domain-containing protein [bacterium]